MHALNVCESAYFLMRNGVSETDAWAVIGNLEVEISDSMSRVLMRRVSALKARHKSFSIGDCVAVAFAEDIKADILTTDNGFSLVGTSANVLLAR